MAEQADLYTAWWIFALPAHRAGHYEVNNTFLREEATGPLIEFRYNGCLVNTTTPNLKRLPESD